jgi:uncharacterized protein with HEPN domain
LLRSAVERQLEIIGEALSRAAEDDKTLIDRIPELPRIVGLRNRIIYGYDSGNDEIVWDVVQNKVGTLEEQIAVLFQA